MIVQQDQEGSYVAFVPGLPRCQTHARSLDELSERIKQAIALYLEVEGDSAEGLDLVESNGLRSGDEQAAGLDLAGGSTGRLNSRLGGALEGSHPVKTA